MSLASLIDELNPQQKQAATTEAKAVWFWLGQAVARPKLSWRVQLI